MKKFNRNYFFARLLILMILSLTINAQDKTFSEHLKNFFKLQEKALPEKQTISFEENIKVTAGKNIEKFLHQKNLLSSQGKSSEEISKILLRSNAAGNGSISGTIYESDGITPISGYLSVYAFDKYGIYAGYGYVGSYSAGQYIIQNLPAGKFYVQTNSNQYFDEFYDNAPRWQEATLVEVFEGQETPNINFSLESPKGVISGKVIDPDENPLNDCYLSAYEITSYSFSSSYTDSLGNFNIGYLKPGSYIIECYYEGEKNFSNQFYMNADHYENATPVILPTEDTLKNINFKLTPGGAITGRIIKDNDSLFLQYDVHLSLYPAAGDYPIAAEYIDSLGYFTFKKLNTDNYKLLAEYYNYSGYENFVDTWYRESYTMEGAEIIHVQKGDTVKNINFTLLLGGAISGKVEVNGDIQGGNIVVFDKNMNYVSGYYTYPSENYTMVGLTPGDYKVNADFQKYNIQWYKNKNDFENGDWVIVNVNDTTKNIDFNLEQSTSPPSEWAIISGYIADPEGMPCNASVRVYDLNGKYIAYTYGYFSYSINVPPGAYKIEIYNSDYGYEWYSNKDSFQKADTVILAAYQTKQIYFKFDYLSTIAGFVTDQGGLRIDGESHSVFAAIFDAATGEYLTDRDITFVGGYELKLRPGNYKLGLIPVYYNEQLSYDSLARTFYKNGVRFNDEGTLQINLFSITDMELEDIKIENVSGSISGTIYDADNQPIDSVAYVLLAFDEDGYLARASFYSVDGSIDGHFKLTGLRNDKYYLLAIATSGEQYLQIQWYDGEDVSQSLEELSLKMDLPDNITAIDVETEEVSGVNFYFNTTTNVKNEILVIRNFALYQNYPNPFNPSTIISWQSPVASHQTLKVYDILGREVATLVNEYRNAGKYEIEFDASQLSSGVYFYQIKAGDPSTGSGKSFIQTRKMILLK